MPAPSKNYTLIGDASIDSDSPLDVTLMTQMRDNLIHLEEWLGDGYVAAKDHDHDGANSKKITDENVIRGGGVLVWDDFVGEAVSKYDTSPGDTDSGMWSFASSGSVSIASNEANGIAKITGGGSAAGIHQTVNGKIFKASASAGNTITIEIRTAINAGTYSSCAFGLLSAEAIPPAHGIFFSITGSNWQATTRASSVSTNTDTGVAAGTSFQKLEIEATSTSVKFYIDDVLKATHTTNIPTILLAPGLLLGADVTSNFYFDYFYCTSNKRV